MDLELYGFGDLNRQPFRWDAFLSGFAPLKVTRAHGFGDDEDAEDEDNWQLRLTFEFEPNNDLRALGDGFKMGDPLSELPDFRAYVYRSPAFTTCTKHQIQRTVIRQLLT